MKSVPSFLLPVVFQCEVLNIEELTPAAICVHSSHMLASVGSLGVDDDLTIECRVHLKFLLPLHQTCVCFLLFSFYQTLNVRRITQLRKHLLVHQA